jgi:hypothetical protein
MYNALLTELLSLCIAPPHGSEILRPPWFSIFFQVYPAHSETQRLMTESTCSAFGPEGTEHGLNLRLHLCQGSIND